MKMFKVTLETKVHHDGDKWTFREVTVTATDANDAISRARAAFDDEGYATRTVGKVEELP